MLENSSVFTVTDKIMEIFSIISKAQVMPYKIIFRSNCAIDMNVPPNYCLIICNMYKSFLVLCEMKLCFLNFEGKQILSPKICFFGIWIIFKLEEMADTDEAQKTEYNLPFCKRHLHSQGKSPFVMMSSLLCHDKGVTQALETLSNGERRA